MSNIKITQLPALDPTPLAGTDVFPVVSGNVTYQVTANAIAAFAGGSANTGNVTFNDITIQGTGDEYGGSGLYLAPGANSTGNLQYLRVRGGDYPTHIHFDTGNNLYFDQYFGADDKYVKLEANGNVVINANDLVGNTATWNFGVNGNLTVPGVITAPVNDPVIVQAIDGDNNVNSLLKLDPNNLLTQLTGYSSQDSNSWTTADWATGVYTTEGGGTIGAVQFTGATTIIDFINTLPNPEYVFIQVNGGPLLPFGGSGGGATNITFYTDVLPATDPTTVTDFAYYYSLYSTIEIDYDSQVLNITANDADIEISTRGAGTDISINAARSLGLTGNGSVDIRNDSSTDNINIVTDNNGLASAWTYGNTGILTLPGEGVVQSNDDTIILQSKDTGTGNVYGLRIGTNGGLYFANTEYPGGWLDITNDAGNANITSSISSSGAAGYNLNLKAGATNQGVFTALPGGDLNLVGGTGGYNDDGIGGAGGDVNIIGGSPGEPGNVSGKLNITTSDVNISTGTAAWAFDNLGYFRGANLSILSGNGLATVASIIEDNGSLNVLANGVGGTTQVGWLSNTSSGLGDTAAVVFNEVGNAGNAVIRTGNTAATSYAWAYSNTGGLSLATVNNESSQFVGTRKIIGGALTGATAPYSVTLAAGGTPTVAYTSSAGVQSVKVTFVTQSTGAGFNWEQFDVAAVASQDVPGAVNFVVSNRVKALSTVPDTVVTATMAGSQIQISLTLDVVQGGGTASFDATEFGLMVD